MTENAKPLNAEYLNYTPGPVALIGKNGEMLLVVESAREQVPDPLNEGKTKVAPTVLPQAKLGQYCIVERSTYLAKPRWDCLILEEVYPNLLMDNQVVRATAHFTLPTE